MTDTFLLSGRVDIDNKQAVAALDATRAGVGKLGQGTTAAGQGAAAAAREFDKTSTGIAKMGSAAGTAGTEIARLGSETAQLTQQSAAQVGRVVDLDRRLDALGSTQKRVTNEAGRLRAASSQLGQQFSDISIGLQSGTPLLTIFGQQVGQVAFAMSGMKGVAGTVGAALSGPLGAAVTGAVVVLGSLATSLFNVKPAAEAAGKGLEDFQRRQADIGNFIDATTGRLREQNETLIRNAVLTRQSSIDANNKSIRAGRDAAFSAAVKLRGDDTPIFTAGGVTQRQVDPELKAAIDGAGKSVILLDRNLQALATRRPELKALIKEVSDNAGAAVIAARENKKLGDEIERLEKRTVGAAAASRSLVEKQVALATATTPLEQARARYNLVLERGAAAEKAGGAALEQYRQDLTRAATAVNSAEAAEKAASATRRDNTKATRDAAREVRELEAALAGLERRYPTSSSLLRTYNDELRNLAELTRAGRASADEAMSIRAGLFADSLRGVPLDEIAAGEKASRDADDAAIQNRADGFARYLEQRLPEVFEESGRRGADAFNRSVLVATEAIGQVIGGSAGKALTGAVGLVQGVRTGDFTAMGGRAGGVLSLVGGLVGDGKGSKPGSFGAVFGDSFRDQMKKTFSPLTDKLDGLFGGSGTFAKTAGQAFAGASTGAAIGGIQKALGLGGSKTGSKTGGAIGGAIGSFLPIPGGEIIGSILGSTIGGLFKSTKKATSTVSAAGGQIDVAAAVGNSASYRRAADALGDSVGSAVEALADQLGGEIGSFSVSVGQRKKKFTVDGSGSGRTKGSGVQKFDTEQEAAEAGLADAIRDGGISGVSPRVQSVLRQYANDINKAIAESLKVKGLEDLLATRDNPFAGLFRNLDAQHKARLDTARKNGFDILEIEKINGEERAQAVKETLEQATGSVKALLDELRFGDLAEGSLGDRRTALVGERDRLKGLAQGGDQAALDALAQVSQKLIALDREAYGSTAPFAASRNETIDLLDGLVRQTEARINAAAGGAAADRTVAQLSEANGSLDDMVALMQRNVALTEQLVGRTTGGGRGFSVDGYMRSVNFA